MVDPDGGSREVKLGDLLSRETMDRIIPVMNRIRSGKTDPIAGKNEILGILDTVREDLLAKGVLAEYLAYVLLSYAMSGPGGDLNQAEFN